MKRRKLVPYILVSSIVLSSLGGSVTVFAEAATKENKSEVVTNPEELTDAVNTEVSSEVETDSEEDIINNEVETKQGTTKATTTTNLIGNPNLDITVGNPISNWSSWLTTYAVTKDQSKWTNLNGVGMEATTVEGNWFYSLNSNKVAFMKSGTGIMLKEVGTEGATAILGQTIETIPDRSYAVSWSVKGNSTLSEVRTSARTQVALLDGENVLSNDGNGNLLVSSGWLDGEAGAGYKDYLEDFKAKSTNSSVSIRTSYAGPARDAYSYHKNIAVYEYGNDVTVKYVDTEGNDLTDSEVLKGFVNDSYGIEEKSFNGYNLVETSGNTDGVFTREDQAVTFIYEKMEGASVTVNHVDTEGNSLAESDVLKGILGSSFESEAKEITGYELKQTPENANGTFTEEAQTVTYVYQAVQDGEVTVNYVDTEGKVLDTLNLTGKINESYTTEAKTIEGYTLKTTPENVTGVFTSTAQTVTYVYEKDTAKPFAVNYVGVQQQKVVGFVPEGVTTSKVSLMIKKDGTNEWVDTGYTATPEAATGYFAIESRFVKDTRDFLLNNKDQIKVVFTAENGDNYEGIQVVQPYTAPIVNDFTEGDEYLTGSVPNGANQVRVSINGNLMRVVNNGSLITDDSGIDAITGAFSIWAKTWCEGAYGSSPIQQTKTGDVITVDYGVQIYGDFNNPSTTIIVK